MTPAPAPGGGTDDPVFGALNATACTLCVAAWDAAAAAAAEAAPGDVAFEIFRWVAIVILVCMSGLFSGLTLGLLGLDLMGLEIVIKGSKDPVERANARKIYEVRKQGNLLLCTLLLGNVAVNSALAILSSEVFSGLGGFFASTFTIVIFGEILPQATCARYALAIGARTVWIVQIFKYLLFVITWPIAKLLDIMLGEEAATFHSQGEMSVMLQNYVKVHSYLMEDLPHLKNGPKLIRLEDFVADPAAHLIDIFTWLGVDASPDTVERVIESVGGSEGIRTEVNAKYMEKWCTIDAWKRDKVEKRYQPQIDELGLDYNLIGSCKKAE